MADNTLALGVRVPTTDFGQIAQNRANTLGMIADLEKQRRAQEAQNAFAAMVTAPNFNPADLRTQANLAATGAPNAAEVIRAAQQARISDINAQNAAREQRKQALTTLGSHLDNLINDPTDEGIARFRQNMMALEVPKDVVDAELSDIARVPVEQRGTIILQRALSDPNTRAAIEAAQPKYKNVNLGGETRTFQENPLAPGFAPAPEVLAHTMTPSEKAASELALYKAQHPDLDITVTPGGQVVGVDKRTNQAYLLPISPNAPPPREAVGAGIPAPRAAPPAAAGAPPAAAGALSIVQNNNPGALEYRPWMAQFGGEPAPDGRFAQFPTAAQGIAAQEQLLRSEYIGKGVNTISAIVDKYAPANAENSPASRANYKATLARGLGVAPTAALSAAQIPQLAELMRGFETGAAGATSAQPEQTFSNLSQAEQQTFSRDALQSIGYDPTTGRDAIADLIPQSTSGMLAAGGAAVKGAVSGQATPGAVAIAQLEALANNLTFQLAKGKLGTGFSNADRDFLIATLGDVANPNKPANARLAAWQTVRNRLLNQASYPATAPGRGGAAPGRSGGAAAPAAPGRGGGAAPARTGGPTVSNW